MTKYFICLMFTVLLSAGCGGNVEENTVEKAIEKETGENADVDFSDEGMHISGKTEDGEFSLSAGKNAKVPDGFPSDVLIYKPSDISSSMDMPQGQSLTLSTSDDGKKVLETYKREMTAKGWAEKTVMTGESQSMLVYGKEGRAVQIHIMPSDDQTEIMIIAGNE